MCPIEMRLMAMTELLRCGIPQLVVDHEFEQLVVLQADVRLVILERHEDLARIIAAHGRIEFKFTGSKQECEQFIAAQTKTPQLKQLRRATVMSGL